MSIYITHESSLYSEIIMHLQDLGCGVKGSENPFLKVEIIIDDNTNNTKRKESNTNTISII